jgi:large subunit ribosomal protein L17
MRHRSAKKILGRDTSHRSALRRNLATSLLIHGKVTTTLSKAKFIRPFVEKMVTKAGKDLSYAGVLKVQRDIQDKKALRILFEQIAPKYVDRPGGYTRIVKLPERAGDNAPMARIEFVDGKVSKKVKKAPKASKTTEVKKEPKKVTKKVKKEEVKDES